MLPKARKQVTVSEGANVSPISAALAAAVLRQRPTADLAHALSFPSIDDAELVDIIYGMFSIVETRQNGLSGTLTWQALGLAMEIYRYPLSLDCVDLGIISLLADLGHNSWSQMLNERS
jgi:hypothetical protein